MKIPVPLQLAVLAVGMTGFYTLVGQAVPQKEVQPPEVIEVSDTVSTAELVEIGKSIFEGKGLCTNCHTIGKSGALRFPDLAGVAERAAKRIPGYSQLDYFAETLYEPDQYVVDGFNPGMPVINKPPVGLTDSEILAVVAFLQTLGGKATVTVDTKFVYTGGSLEGSGATPDVPAGDVPVAETTAADAPQTTAASAGDAG